VLPGQTARFELECYLREVDDHLAGVWVFNTDVFDASTIERLQGHFQTLLKAIVADPAQPVSRLPLLTAAERQQLLVEWNATETAYPRDATLAERFEAQAAATPDSVALVFEEQQLTYRELNTRASHLAQYLRHQHGVGREVCVGLCMERSIEMVVGLLGIVKAGGVYVPLDPDMPPERLAFILEDADVTLVLTEDAVREELPAEWSGPVIALDTEWGPIAQTPVSNLTSDVGAENLAYIMYTSGSTGRPKGIGISQRAVIRLVLETNYIDLTASDRVAQTSTISFDAATFELWGALLNGCQLVIIPKAIALSPQD
jgi:non-ribosomal peptide synthetase component F